MAEEVLQPTTVTQFRSRNKPFLLKVSERLTVLMRPIDATEAFFSSIISLPMLQMRDRFEEMERKAKNPEEIDALKGAELINDMNETGMKEFLQKYAVAAVINPKIVMTEAETKDQEALWVGELNQMELMTIWNAEPTGKEAPVISPEAAQEFRRTEQALDDPNVPPRENVRTETKLVDFGSREAISA
jgi:hypothetical protein